MRNLLSRALADVRGYGRDIRCVLACWLAGHDWKRGTGVEYCEDCGATTALVDWLPAQDHETHEARRRQ